MLFVFGGGWLFLLVNKCLLLPFHLRLIPHPLLLTSTFSKLATTYALSHYVADYTMAPAIHVKVLLINKIRRNS
jgi:hypothetical protein